MDEAAHDNGGERASVSPLDAVDSSGKPMALAFRGFYERRLRMRTQVLGLFPDKYIDRSHESVHETTRQGQRIRSPSHDDL